MTSDLQACAVCGMWIVFSFRSLLMGISENSYLYLVAIECVSEVSVELILLVYISHWKCAPHIGGVHLRTTT